MITMDNITREGNKVLRKRAETITFPMSEEEIKMAKKLMTFLENSQDENIAKKYKLRAGVGLAAPQIGISKRMAAVLVPGINGDNPIFKNILINPTIIRESVQKAALAEGEGCLSVDRNVPGYVPRSDRIKVRWFDTKGNKHIDNLRDYPAIVIQHEIDHLNGTLFFDHINKSNPFTLLQDTIIIE